MPHAVLFFYRLSILSILLSAPFHDKHLLGHKQSRSSTMARSAGIHISLTTLTVLALVEGNMKDTVTSLGWRSISVAPINHQTRRLSKDLAKHGIHVRLSQSLCNSPHNESLDGTVTDMKTYNETLFQQTLSCGMKI